MKEDRKTKHTAYYRVKLHGGLSYISSREELGSACDGEVDGLDHGESITLTLTRVKMSDAEYNKLPEFTGH